MTVELVSYSEPAHAERSSLEDLVCYCARVSNPSNQLNTSTNKQLLKYLIKHKHWSPFEMVSICLEIETTRDIARQILRHRSFSFQEFSQRYADPVAELDFMLRETRLQDVKNRQNSLDTEDVELIEEWVYRQNLVIEMIKANYQWARSHNIAKEQARVILPEGNTISRLYMNGTLRSWIHYIQLRTDPSTQKEHREIAEECKEEIKKIFPLIEEII